MTPPGARLRPDDERSALLLGALVVSLLAHLALFFVLQLGSQLHWWDSNPLERFARVQITPEDRARIEQLRQQAQREQEQDVPMTFVQVTRPSDLTPPEAQFYSSASSLAANPDPVVETGAPQIDGTQTLVAKTETTPLAVPGPAAPPQPLPPAPAPEATPAPDTARQREAALPEAPEPPRPDVQLADQATPKVDPGLGQLARATPETAPALARPADTTYADNAPPVRERPRTLAEARARQALIAGEKMKQDGGVARRGPVQLQVKGLPFGAYDEAMFAAIQSRWFSLLDERRYAGGTGRVRVQFKQYQDGSVRLVEPTETTVDALFTAYCLRAITDPAPYGRWPADMARMLGTNFREITVTFYYH